MKTGAIITTACALLVSWAQAKPWDCEKLTGTPQEDLRWNFETASQVKCKARSKMLQHWTITIPNDRIFDDAAIRLKGEHACGSAVFDAVDAGWCGKGWYSCSLGEDGIAHLQFSCGSGTDVKHINRAFHEATCHAFPEVLCYKE